MRGRCRLTCGCVSASCSWSAVRARMGVVGDLLAVLGGVLLALLLVDGGGWRGSTGRLRRAAAAADGRAGDAAAAGARCWAGESEGAAAVVCDAPDPVAVVGEGAGAGAGDAGRKRQPLVPTNASKDGSDRPWDKRASEGWMDGGRGGGRGGGSAGVLFLFWLDTVEGLREQGGGRGESWGWEAGCVDEGSTAETS